MPACTIIRTHRRGHALRDRDFDPPVSGPIRMGTTIHPTLKRYVNYLVVARNGQFGADEAPPIPALWEPELLTFMSDRAMMLAGFEEIEGQRYYQGWWIQWIDP